MSAHDVYVANILPLPCQNPESRVNSVKGKLASRNNVNPPEQKQVWTRAAGNHNDNHVPKKDDNNDSWNDSDHYSSVSTLISDVEVAITRTRKGRR